MAYKQYQHVSILIAACLLSLSSQKLQSQTLEASARYYTEKSYILEDEAQVFNIELSNPTSIEFEAVRAVVSFNKNVEVRGLDKRCSQWRPNNQTQLVCVIPALKAQSFLRLSYYIVGDVQLRPGFASALAVTSLDNSIPVIEQAPSTIGFSDDSRFVEGATLNIAVARDILRDTDGDGVSDVSESVLRTDPTDPNSASSRNALVDLAVLHSLATDEYYSGHFGGRIEQLIAVTNQIFDASGIGITVRLVAMGAIDYLPSSGADIDAVGSDFIVEPHEAFSELESLIEGTGADAVVFAHPIFRNTEDESCYLGLSNSVAVQGDFYPEVFGGRMLSVIDASRDCISANNLASMLAINMGIVPSRAENPDGGTFSFSSGYVQDGFFATHLPANIRLSTPLSQFTARLLQFSSPEKLCFGVPCGISRNNLSRGADAVFSMNATRYVIEDLNPSVVPFGPSDTEPRATINGSNSGDLQVLQYPSVASVINSDWVTFNVEARNNSDVVLNNLEFRFIGSPNAELLRNHDSQCVILTTQDSEPRAVSAGVTEGEGDIACYVRALDPDQVAGFSYSRKIESEINETELQAHFQFAFVNNIIKPESQVCIPVHPTASAAAMASTICPISESSELNKADINNVAVNLNLTQLPFLEGSILTVPYIRLPDGRLLSAQFVYNQGPVLTLKLVDVIYLGSDISPNVISEFDAEGMLVIRRVAIDEDEMTLILKYLEGSTPPVFVEADYAGI